MRPSASGKTRSARTLSASRSASAVRVVVRDAEQHEQPGADRGDLARRRRAPAARDDALRPAPASRPRAAARPTARARRCTGAAPAPSSSPARCVSRGMMSIRQQKCSAPRGAVRTHMFSGGEAPSRRRRRSSASCSSARAGRPVVLEARARAPRGEHQLERQLGRPRREQHRLVVDRDDALAQPDLLLHVVAEQVAAHRAHRVGAEALALAGDRGGHEVQRVELRVRVRQRRAGLAGAR